MSNPQQKVAVVTGAAKGIGQALAKRLHQDGFQLVLIDKDTCSETVALFSKNGQPHREFQCDVSNPTALRETAQTVLAHFCRADVLVNNAGVYPFMPFEQITLEEFRRVMSINLEPLLTLSQAFLPGMKEKQWGRIVNVASNSLYMAVGGLTHYQASKGGVIGFTRGLAGEVGDFGITVNCISPALTLTPGSASIDMALHRAVVAMQCIKRHGVPADYEGVVSFLASDDSSFITAQEFIVDGGLGR